MRRRASSGLVAAVAWTLLAPLPAAAALDLVGHAGLFDAGRDHEAVEAGFELRRPVDLWGLELVTGLSATTDSSVWAWGGLRRDFAIGKRWLVAPGWATVLFEDGDGKDLGGVLLFRTSLTVSYLVGRGARLGVAYTHLSNANLYDHNPGANSILVNLRVPLGR